MLWIPLQKATSLTIPRAENERRNTKFPESQQHSSYLKNDQKKRLLEFIFYIYSKIQTCLIKYYHYTACWLQPWSETLLGLQRLSSPLSLREVFPKRKWKLAKYAKYWIAKAVQSIVKGEVFPERKWKLAKYAKYWIENAVQFIVTKGSFPKKKMKTCKICKILDCKGCTVHC